MRNATIALCGICLAVGLVVGSCSDLYTPVVAHADATSDLAMAIDYFSGLDSPAVEALGPAGYAVSGAVFATRQALEHPIEGIDAIDASAFTTFSGVYAVGSGSNRQIKLATVSIYSGSFNASDGDGLAFIYGSDYDNICRFYGNFQTIRSRATQYGTSFTVELAGLGGSGYMEIYNFHDNTSAVTSSSYQPWLAFNVHSSSYIPAYRDVNFIAQYGYLGNSRPDMIGNAKKVELPAGIIDSNYPQILAAWVDENYPEYSYLFPEVAPTPVYPSEFVTGFPKDWTVENPPLPTSPQMDISIPDASLPDLSGLSEYTDGVGFWWSLTGWIMDTFGIREIVMLLIGLGVFAFLIYRLGAG